MKQDSSVPRTASVLRSLRRAIRITALLFVVGFIVQLNSERAYWFQSIEWFGSRMGETLGTAAFYGFAAAAALWFSGRVTHRGVHQAILMGALFAWTVEGAIVYVVHEAGPFDPFFPAMFAGWHGLLSFVFFFYLVRKWLIQGSTRLLALTAAGYGLVWGVWASVSWLPDSDEAIAALGVASRTEPLAFGIFALTLTAALAFGHMVLDRLWPGEWRPSAVSGWMILGLTGLLAAASFFAIPWAPIRWAALAAIPLLGLMWSNRGDAGPNLYEALAGRIEPRDGLALVPMAALAALAYLSIWVLDPSPATLEAIRFGHVTMQFVAGGGALVWAMRRARRDRAAQAVPTLLGAD